MKKSNKSVLAFVLALVMLLGLCVPTLATSGEFESYDTYLCIGDSVFAGTGMPLPEGTEVNTSNMPSVVKETADEYYWGYDYSRVSGSCHDLIAKALSNSDGGATELIQGARSALRAVEVRYMLEGGALNDADTLHKWDEVFYAKEDADVEYSINDIDTMNSYVGGEAGKSMVDQVQKADLITVELGLNDVFGTATTMLYNMYTAEDSDSDTAAVVKKYLGDGEDVSTSDIIRMLGALNSAEILLDFKTALADSLEVFQTNYNAILTRIQELNPQAEIVTVGAYNPIESASGLLDVLESVSKYMSMNAHTFITGIRASAENAVQDINTTIKDAANAHGCRYADINKTTTWGIDKEILKSDNRASEAFAKIHPDAEGHKYIAQQVLNTLTDKRGDLDRDGLVTDADAVYLQKCIETNTVDTLKERPDYNGDGNVDGLDAVYLLNHTLNPNRYTLH